MKNYSQEFNLRKTIQGDFDHIYTDELGNFYTLGDNTIRKYTADGKKTNNYTNYMAGEISFADCGDPFKILLYYQDFSQIEILDNTLSPINKIELAGSGYDLATLACASYQSGFWLYNPQFYELIRFNQFAEITDRTGNIYNATGIKPDPNYMIEKDNLLYVNNPDTGIMMFDKYGSYFKTIATKDLNNFQVLNNMIVITDDDFIKIINPQNFEENLLKLPQQDVLEGKISYINNNKNLYLLKKSGVYIYSFHQK